MKQLLDVLSGFLDQHPLQAFINILAILACIRYLALKSDS